jgi:predicted phage baseplate assembly protein
MARLRFGDDLNGRRPNSATPFTATYRVGNGSRGNVGRDAIRHVLTGLTQVVEVRNPLPAVGGAEPETMEAVRQAAPYAYRRQERAVTPEDYAEVARRHPDVQRAVATLRWNGHGYTVFVTVDRFGGRPITAEFEQGLIDFLDRFRMAGYDLEVDAPRFAALELGLFVCADKGHFRSQVRQAVLRVLGTRVFPNGGRGFFHPDNFTFGQPVYLSAIYARVMGIEGVSSVRATLFRRRGRPDPRPLLKGVIEFGRLEIAQLENDPNFPERGVITVEMGGGK